jgi:hypothetical protein
MLPLIGVALAAALISLIGYPIAAGFGALLATDR